MHHVDSLTLRFTSWAAVHTGSEDEAGPSAAAPAELEAAAATGATATTLLPADATVAAVFLCLGAMGRRAHKWLAAGSGRLVAQVVGRVGRRGRERGQTYQPQNWANHCLSTDHNESLHKRCEHLT